MKYKAGDVVRVSWAGPNGELILKLAIVWQVALVTDPRTKTLTTGLVVKPIKDWAELCAGMVVVLDHLNSVRTASDICPWCAEHLQWGDESEDERFCKKCATLNRYQLHNLNPFRVHRLQRENGWFLGSKKEN